MRKLIAIITALVAVVQAGKAQAIADTLTMEQLTRLENFSELYTLPHARYQLDHFVFVHQTKRVDPTLQRVNGQAISAEAKKFFERFMPGDTLLIKQVFAHYTHAPEKGMVKMPDKRFILK